MTPDELYARLLLVPDSTQEIIRLIGTIDYDRAVIEYKPDATRTAARTAAWDAAWRVVWDVAQDAAWNAARTATWDAALDTARDAARGAAWDAAWGAAWEAARDTAWDAALLAGAMVVHDILEKAHRDVALSRFCWWLQFRKEI